MTDKPITYPQTEEAIHIGDFDLGTCYGASEPTPASKNSPIISDRQRGVYLYHANCLELMGLIAEKHPQGCFDMIFADPPYFLSNDGITCQNGQKQLKDKKRKGNH